MTTDMSRHFTWGALLKFTAPSIAMMIFTSIYGIVDGLFVSNFAGKTAFAAVNFAMPIIMILSPVGYMIGTGGSALVAKTRGEGDEVRANRYFSLLIYAALIMGVVLAVAGIIWIEPLCALMGAEGQMLEDAGLYGRLVLMSLPFYVLQFAFQSFFVTAGKPQLGFYVILIAGLTNIVLDALFVGALNLGIMGAAWATNICEVLGGGLPLIYFIRKNNSYLKLGKTTLDWRALGKACLNGSSEMVTTIAMSLVSVLYNLQLMSYIGEDGVAAYGVIQYVILIFAGVFLGYSMGSSPLMSFQYGAQNIREMKNLLKKSLIFVAVGGVVMLGLAEILARPLAMIFVGYDEGLCVLTEGAFRIYSISFIFMGFSIYGSAFFTSLNNGIVSSTIALLRALVFEAGAVILIPLLLGIDGIWLSIIVAEIASVIVTAAFMLSLGKRYGYLSPRADTDTTER